MLSCSTFHMGFTDWYTAFTVKHFIFVCTLLHSSVIVNLCAKIEIHNDRSFFKCKYFGNIINRKNMKSSQIILNLQYDLSTSKHDISIFVLTEDDCIDVILPFFFFLLYSSSLDSLCEIVLFIIYIHIVPYYLRASWKISCTAKCCHPL